MDDEEDVSDHKQYAIHEGIVFLIELSPDIFEPLKELNNRSQFLEILNSINDLMAELIITLPKTGVGIYLYNSEHTSEGYKQGISKIFKLKDLNISNMKYLNDLIHDDLNEIKKIDTKFSPSKAKVELPLVLNFIMDEFLSQDYFNNKKLFWFINDDKPYDTDDIKLTLRKIINDLNDYKINITPLLLDTNKKFNLKCYEEIFLNTNYLNNFNEVESMSNTYDGHGNYNQVFDGANLKTTLATKIRDKILRLKEIKRIQFSCNLILASPNLGISVKGYVLYNHEKPKRSTWLYNKSETLKIVHTKTANLNDTTGNEITPSKLRKGFSLGDETLFLNNEQIKLITNYTMDNTPPNVTEEEHETILLPPYLKLVGFRKRNKFKPQENLSKSVFVTVNANGPYTNSFKLFSSLYQSLVSLNRFAIVFGCIKKNSVPSIFALYPTEKSKGRFFPEGFYLIKLPWRDDLRSIPPYVMENCLTNMEEDGNIGEKTIPKDLIASNKKLIQQFFLSKSYIPSEYRNPTLNYFFKILRMDLLQLDLSNIDIRKDLDSINNDYTIEKIIDIRNIIIKELNQSNYIKDEQGNMIKVDDALNSKPTLLKFINQILNKSTNNDFIKRDIPIKKTEPELTDQDVLTGWKNNRLGEFKVNQLKKFITKHKEIATASRKADIIENISQFLQEKFPNENLA